MIINSIQAYKQQSPSFKAKLNILDSKTGAAVWESTQKHSKELVNDTLAKFIEFKPGSSFEISYNKTLDLKPETFKIKDENGESVDIGRDFVKGIVNFMQRGNKN